jgi:hypothetical protein
LKTPISYNIKIWKYSGIFLLATGALHTVVALLMGADEFIGMIRDVATLSAYGTHELFIAFPFDRKLYKDRCCPAY